MRNLLEGMGFFLCPFDRSSVQSDVTSDFRFAGSASCVKDRFAKTPFTAATIA